MNRVSMQWVRGTIEKVSATFLEAWLAAWLVLEGATPADLVTAEVAGIGFAAAVATFVKCLASLKVGNRESASMVE